MGAYKSIITDIQLSLETGDFVAVLEQLRAVTVDREERALLLLAALELSNGDYGNE